MDVALAVSADAASRSATRSRNGEAGAAPLIRMVCFKNRLGPEFSLTLRPNLEAVPAALSHPADPVVEGDSVVAGRPRVVCGDAPGTEDARHVPANTVGTAGRYNDGNGLEHVTSRARATLAPLYAGLPGFAVCSSPAASRHSDDVAKLRELITATPGLSQTQIMDRCDIPEKRVADMLREHAGKEWRVEAGPRGAILYFPQMDPEEAGEESRDMESPE